MRFFSFQDTNPKADPNCNANDRVCVITEGNPTRNAPFVLKCNCMNN